jgi:hypothetical protein
MAKKETKNERIFAGCLKPDQKVLCDDGRYRLVVKVDPILDPSKANFNTNEVIAYIDYEGTIKQEFRTGSVVVKVT